MAEQKRASWMITFLLRHCQTDCPRYRTTARRIVHWMCVRGPQAFSDTTVTRCTRYCLAFRRLHDVIWTSLLYQNDVVESFRRNSVSITPCATVNWEWSGVVPKFYQHILSVICIWHGAFWLWYVFGTVPHLANIQHIHWHLFNIRQFLNFLRWFMISVSDMFKQLPNPTHWYTVNQCIGITKNLAEGFIKKNKSMLSSYTPMHTSR